MTITGYFFFTLATAFGYRRRSKRLSIMATETFLLKEAEAYLGKELWEDTENIEALSLEYWNLRKLNNQRVHILAELDECEQNLTKIYQKKTDIEAHSDDPSQDLLNNRQNYLNSLDKLAKQRDEIINNANNIRRAYESIKSKQEILTKEGANNSENFENITNSLSQLKSEFATLKLKLAAVAKRIVEEDSEIDKIDVEIMQHQKNRRTTDIDTQQLGNINHKISTLRADLISNDTETRQLYIDIGKYVSRNFLNPECLQLRRKKRGLIKVMQELRKSILLNRKLAEMN
jgi:chromosome segregation ATPase